MNVILQTKQAAIKVAAAPEVYMDKVLILAVTSSRCSTESCACVSWDTRAWWTRSVSGNWDIQFATHSKSFWDATGFSSTPKTATPKLWVQQVQSNGLFFQVYFMYLFKFFLIIIIQDRCYYHALRRTMSYFCCCTARGRQLRVAKPSASLLCMTRACGKEGRPRFSWR